MAACEREILEADRLQPALFGQLPHPILLHPQDQHRAGGPEQIPHLEREVIDVPGEGRCAGDLHVRADKRFLDRLAAQVQGSWTNQRCHHLVERAYGRGQVARQLGSGHFCLVDRIHLVQPGTGDLGQSIPMLGQDDRPGLQVAQQGLLGVGQEGPQRVGWVGQRTRPQEFKVSFPASPNVLAQGGQVESPKPLGG